MTRVPLYAISFDEKPSNTGNTGLWYNKFCDQWRDDTWSLQTNTGGAGSKKSPKQLWIDTVADRKAGDAGLLLDAVERRREMVDRVSGMVMSFITVAPFITGLGNPHPIENGFTWHHLFGTPYLPASSVKGLVRDWAAHWADDEKGPSHKAEAVTRIFGADDKDENKNTGSIIFLDAIPTRPVRLKSEIITPHYGAYYQSAVESPVTPADWLSPTPIPFPAVAEKQEFQFALISRCGDANDPDLTMVADWLIAALETVGAGGKTTVGYGTFRRSGRELPKEEQWRLKLAQLKPADLVKSFSRNWSKTQQQYGEDLELYKKLIIEIHGPAIQPWEASKKKNEKKAYRNIFSAN